MGEQQQLKVGGGVSAIEDSDVQVDMVDMDGNVVGTIAKSDAYETDEEIVNEQGEIVGYAACSSSSLSPEREKSANRKEESPVATQPFIASSSPTTGTSREMSPQPDPSKPKEAKYEQDGSITDNEGNSVCLAVCLGRDSSTRKDKV